MRRTRKPNPTTKPAATRRTFLAGIDAIELFEMLERHYDDDGGADGSAYRRLYRESLKAFLERDGPEAVTFAQLLEAIESAGLVETDMKKAGFVVGFECCRQLLLGELDLDVLKGEE